MAKLEINLLGGLELRLGGKTLSFQTRHCALLLACLAMTPEMRMTRGQVTELLWPDRADKQARGTLRQTLYRLKKVIGDLEPSVLNSDQCHIWLNAEAVQCDVATFRQAVTGNDDGLDKAFALYEGELMEGHGAGGETFEAWLSDERVSLRKLATICFLRLAASRYADRRFGDMETTACKLAAIDPLDEAAYRLWMAGLALQGRRNAALAVYKDLCQLLQSELGVEPEPETEALYMAIRDGGLPSADETTPRHADEIDRLIGRRSREQLEPMPTMGSTHSDGSSGLPERPYVAVLPFDTLSDKSDREHSSDGITEELIAALSRGRAFYVIARNTRIHRSGPRGSDQESERAVGCAIRSRWQCAPGRRPFARHGATDRRRTRSA